MSGIQLPADFFQKEGVSASRFCEMLRSMRSMKERKNRVRDKELILTANSAV